VNLQLQVASQQQTVLVTAASASAEVEAVNEERAADNILQILPVEIITSLPSANLGNAIRRLPSVSLTRNEGEDQFVQVRGTEPRLNNTTVNGFNMPSEDPGTREFDFSAIPAGIVDSIQISKTLQANMDGDGIGGSVDLVTKTATDKPTYEISAVGGYTPIENGRPNTDNYGTWGRRFGAGNGSYKDGYNVFYGPVAAYVRQNPSQFTFSNDQWVDPSDYGIVEHIPAFYVMNTTDFGRGGIRLVLGLRAEFTTDSIHNLAFNKDTGAASPNRFSASYTDCCPAHRCASMPAPTASCA
jgi:outer membrane cobalamin receptor